jgi:SpoVK/Ycf46/Vps4 family AAA+-type ATPase
LGVHVIDGYPMLLTIQGPPGDGKSFQARYALHDAGFQVVAASSTLLSGSFEGEPITQMREIYIRAAGMVDSQHPPAILLEDFDLSPANVRDGTRYTVNTQLLTGFLMNLADDPSMCDVGTSSRIPIVLTANNLTALYMPLARPGRMDFFSWIPSADERAEMIFSALEHRVAAMSLDQAARIARKHPRASLAMIVAASNECAARVCYELAGRTNGQTFLDDLRRALRAEPPISIEDVTDALKRIAETGPRGYAS